jgi:hypothetical protein
MNQLTVEEQIGRLRPAVRIGLARRLHWWLVGLAAVLVIVGLVVWNPVPLVIAAFLGVVGVAERQAGPNLVAAVTAFDEGVPSTGEAAITIVPGDTDDHYHVVLRERGRPDGEYEFIPQGWQPVEGSHPARIWRSDGGTPVLAAVEKGVLIPRRRP